MRLYGSQTLEKMYLFRVHILGVILLCSMLLWVLFTPRLANGQADSLAIAEDLSNQGRVLVDSGQYRSAEPLFLEALEIRRRVLGEDHPDYATSLSNLAVTFQLLGRYEAAYPMFVEALEVRRRVFGKDHPVYATSLNYLAGLYAALSRYEEAEPLYVEAMEIRRRALGDNSLNYAESLNNVADLYRSLGRYSESESLFLTALEIHRNVLGEEHPRYLINLNNLAELYVALGRFMEAESLHVEISETRRRVLGENHPQYATSLNNLALLYNKMSRYQEAEASYLEVLEIRRRVFGEDHPDYATSLNNLASLYETLGRYEQAEPMFDKVLDIFRSTLGENHPLYAVGLVNRASLYQTMGHYAEAEPLFVQALEINSIVLSEDHPRYSAGLNNLATFYYTLGRYAEAEALLKRALENRRSVLGEDHTDYALSLNNLAVLYEFTRRYDKAESLYLEALEVRLRAFGEEHPKYASSLGNLAGLYQTWGRLDDAESLYVKAMAIDRDVLGKHHPDLAHILNNLASLYQRLSRYSEAEALFLESSEIRLRAFGEDHPTYGAALNNLAMLYNVMGQYGKALPLMDRALHIDQVNLQRVFNFSSEPAMRAYLGSLSASVEVLISLALDRNVDASVQQLALDWSLRRKGILFEALIRFRKARTLLIEDPQVAANASQLKDLRQQLNDVQLNPASNIEQEERKESIDGLSLSIGELEADLYRLLSAERDEDGHGRITSGNLQHQLDEGEALIEIVQYHRFDFDTTETDRNWHEERYVAFVIRGGDSDPTLVDLGEVEVVNELIGEFRQSMRDAQRSFERGSTSGAFLEEEFRFVSNDLYKLVFAPLESELSQSTKLYVSPDGELNRIPFAALVDDEDRYLIERYQIAYLTSGRDILQEPTVRGEGTVVFAGPAFDLGRSDRQAGANTAQLPDLVFEGRRSRGVRGLNWNALPGAAAEADEIQRSLSESIYGPVDVYVDSLALEEIFKKITAPRVLHIATHGFFLENEEIGEDETRIESSGDVFATAQGLARLRETENPLMRSGLVLAGANRLGESEGEDTNEVEDGWVTAEEIALMDLQGTELVVLSACETGLGDVETGEGVHGLRRAFVYAGAETLIISLFKVPDEETRALMSSFYDGLKKGKDKLSALHEAQLDMIASGREKHGAIHPFFWSGFIAVGHE